MSSLSNDLREDGLNLSFVILLMLGLKNKKPPILAIGGFFADGVLGLRLLIL